MEGLDRTKLANQRDVVRNERRQGEGQPPTTSPTRRSNQLLFPEGPTPTTPTSSAPTPTSKPPASPTSATSTSSSTPPTTPPSPSPETSTPQLKALLTKYFGPIPQGPPVAPVTVTTPAITSQRRATVTDSVKLPQLTIAWLTPAHLRPRLRRRRGRHLRPRRCQGQPPRPGPRLQNPGRPERHLQRWTPSSSPDRRRVHHHRQARRQARRPRSHRLVRGRQTPGRRPHPG